MALVIPYSHTFGGLSSPVPLSYLDTNFGNVETAVASLNTFGNYYVDTGAVNAYAITLGVGEAMTLAAGLPIQVKIANTNTTASTIAINGGAVTPIKTLDGSATAAGQMIAGGISLFQYDGTNFQLLNSALGALSPITNSLGGDVALNNTANYFDGPSVAQGTSGTWFASGTVTMNDAAGPDTFDLKLWDGSTVIASTVANMVAGNNPTTASLSGFLASPVGNLRISVKDPSRNTGLLVFNATGNSKDCTITAIRVS